MAAAQITSLPYPPRDLLRRIGPMGEENPVKVYEDTGRLHRDLLQSVLPRDWTWPDKRVLDFGCGVGRVLRQFIHEADNAEFWGCDLDTPSVEWLQKNLSPPFRIFESSEEPGLPQEDGYFDLIYAFSVYTHFTDNWAGWLLEHHRVLADGGFLFATFLGRGMLEPLTGEKWDEDQIGMNPLMHGYSWDKGGPIAINSPWWIRAHWGRAFEIVELLPVIEEGAPSHGIVLARKKPATLTVADLLALEPNEPREIKALRHHVEQLADETERLRHAHDLQAAQLEALQPSIEALESMKDSLSWRLTAPLRASKQRLTRRRVRAKR
jgi:SAM-dependent methyltransferase